MNAAVRKVFAPFQPPTEPEKVESLKPHQYDEIRSQLAMLAGIELGPNKQILVESRLRKRLQGLHLVNFAQYIECLQNSPEEVTEFINSLTTNKTDWFREPAHFSYLTDKVLPELYQQKSATGDKTVYLWSAASSTGEEIYSLSMSLKEKLKVGYDFRILGTDIDTHVLAKAKAGIYSKDLVKEQVPPMFLSKYFQDASTANSQLMKVNTELRRNAKFREFNLIEGNLGSELRFDVIFLRNVLIYFTPPTIERVINRLCRYLRPNGYLFIGHSESLSGLTHPLTQVSESVYRLKGV